jgi:hypothetical protein
LETDWVPNQRNEIKFVLVDANRNEVSGLGNTFVVTLSKPGDNTVALASSGDKSELGSGWYRYYATAEEADTYGVIAIKITGAGVVQQNLYYVIGEPTVNAIEFTYTLTSDLDASPIEGAEIQFTTDAAGAHIVWTGLSDSFGVARDSNGNLPRLDAGTYYVWRQHSSYLFDDPDLENVS